MSEDFKINLDDSEILKANDLPSPPYNKELVEELNEVVRKLNMFEARISEDDWIVENEEPEAAKQDAEWFIEQIASEVVSIYVQLIQDGNEYLTRGLPTLASLMASALDRLSSEHPELVQKKAMERLRWPHMCRRGELPKHFERLKLGQALPINHAGKFDL